MNRRVWLHAVGALWCLSFLVLGLRWLRSPDGYPFAEEEVALNPVALLERPAAAASIATTAAMAFVLLCLSLRATWPPRRKVGMALVVVGLGVAILVSDVSAIQLLGYLPMIVLSTVFDIGPDMPVTLGLVWPSIVAFANVVGGVALALVGRDVVRRADGVCTACGRNHALGSDQREPAIVRHQRWWVAMAVAVPLFYALTRYAWAVGIPLGVDQELLDGFGSLRYVGAGLATGAVVGAVLTTGLASRWGTIFPRWVPGLRGRLVPTALAVVPGYLVSAVIMSASVTFWTIVLSGQLAYLPGAESDWAAWLPELFWPLWALGLFQATRGYALRRATRTEPSGSGNGSGAGPGRVCVGSHQISQGPADIGEGSTRHDSASADELLHRVE